MNDQLVLRLRLKWPSASATLALGWGKPRENRDNHLQSFGNRVKHGSCDW